MCHAKSMFCTIKNAQHRVKKGANFKSAMSFFDEFRAVY